MGGELQRNARRAPVKGTAHEGIGGRLQALRTMRGLTLERLADATGLTKSYLSKIENAHKVPPIATLSRIAHALGTGIGGFFGGGRTQARESASLVRKGERLGVVRGGTAFGYDYVALAHKRLAKRMDPFIFTFPSRMDRHVFFEHDGEEFVFILSGSVVFQVGDERWTLEEGDSLYFDAQVPHRGWGVGREAKALVVVSSRAADSGVARRRPRAKRQKKV
jgi:transcriptional regulator with XRE-family HTH domain